MTTPSDGNSLPEEDVFKELEPIFLASLSVKQGAPPLEEHPEVKKYLATHPDHLEGIRRLDRILKIKRGLAGGANMPGGEPG